MLDNKNKARMAAILLATSFRRFGLMIKPETTRIADWQGEGKSVVVIEDTEGVHLLPFEGSKGKVNYVSLSGDHVKFLTGKVVPVVYGYDPAHDILVVLKLDETLEMMYEMFKAGESKPFTGKIDKVKVHDHVLTPREVQDEYEEMKNDTSEDDPPLYKSPDK